MSRAGRFGIVTIPVVHVRRHARHDAELRNQLLLGETVRIDAERESGAWLRVEGRADGYSGWVRAWGVQRAGESAVRRWEGRSRTWFGAPATELREPGTKGRPLGPLFLGSRVRLLSRDRAGRNVELPDGSRARIPERRESPAGDRRGRLEARLRSLRGAPYLWGGRTIAGIDCSGLTQLALREIGIDVPRDARDQFRAAPRLRTGDRLQWGDLAFFGRSGEPVSHVAILLDHCSYVHARGTVHEGSLDPSNPLCDMELLAQVRGFGRPGATPLRAVKSTPGGRESP